jgi:hypothetical protein
MLVDKTGWTPQFFLVQSLCGNGIPYTSFSCTCLMMFVCCISSFCMFDGNPLPSGKLTKNYRKWPYWIGKNHRTKWSIFHRTPLVYWRLAVKFPSFPPSFCGDFWGIAPLMISAMSWASTRGNLQQRRGSTLALKRRLGWVWNGMFREDLETVSWNLT